jgi:hypothetical protein
MCVQRYRRIFLKRWENSLFRGIRYRGLNG